MERASGILMPISSLPSPYGIGTLGREARKFVDFLARAKQRWWQMLPVGPTSYGDSPYQSFSTYAGNPYFIDLDLLARDKLLKRSECAAIDWGSDPTHTDYGKLYEHRFALLKKATLRGWDRDAEEVEAFARENESWLGDYALFMACKRHFGMAAWTEWPDRELRLRKPEALDKYRQELLDDVKLFTYIQFLFFKQWAALRSYAKEKGVGIIGDLPIYVALDSADVWSEPEQFQLDEDNVPTAVAGVPPDYFTADGQLWGNPLYRWDEMKNGGYNWWIRRIGGAAKLYDVIRIDHFRGLEAYWSVPYGETTARNGHWVKGPGMDFVSAVTGWFKDVQFIAEDLGYMTPELAEFLRQSGLPGMKVLQFAFDHREPSNHMPHTYPYHCVCYVGTHDNATLHQWATETDRRDVALAREYLGVEKNGDLEWAMLRAGMASTADLFVTQMQDYLGLGAEARMNTPGTTQGNWTWRMEPGALTPELAKRIACMTKLYGRSNQPWQL